MTDDVDALAAGSSLDDAALALRVREFVRRARDHASKWRLEAEEAYAFVAGDQWTAEERAILQEDGRPAITFNRMAPIVEAVAGSEVNNRQEVRFLPRSVEDQGASDIATNLVRWARQQCEAEDEESHTFSDMVISGMGWCEYRMDYADSPEGMIVLERFDPAEALWDPAARKKNLADAKELGRARRWRLDDAQAEWPEHADALTLAPQAQGPAAGIQRALDAPNDYDPSRQDAPEGRVPMVEIVHYQWCEMQPVAVYAEGGKRMEMPQAAFRKVAERLEGMGQPAPEHVTQKRRVWMQAFVAGNTVLERGPCPWPKGPTLLCMTAKLDRNTGLFYGIVRAMLDPQRWSNKWLAQTLHILNTSAKSGLLIEEGAADDTREIERRYALPGSVVKLNPGAISGGMIKEKTSPGLPAGFVGLMQFAIEAVPDTTGINREMLGLADRDQAGVLEAQRKQAAQAILAPIFDARRRYHKRGGELLLHMVRTFIPKDMQVRVLGEEGDIRFLTAAMLPDAAQFDVIADEAPTSPNQKAEVWQMLTPMLPTLLKLAPAGAILELLAFSPLPASTVAKIKQAVRDAEGAQQKPDPAMVKAQADVEATRMRTEADIAAGNAKAQADIQVQAVKAQADIALKAEREQARQREDAAAKMVEDFPGIAFVN